MLAVLLQSRGVDFSLRWLLLFWSVGSRHMGLSSCSKSAQLVVACGPRCPEARGASTDQALAVSPVLASGFLPTTPPGESRFIIFVT